MSPQLGTQRHLLHWCFHATNRRFPSSLSIVTRSCVVGGFSFVIKENTAFHVKSVKSWCLSFSVCFIWARQTQYHMTGSGRGQRSCRPPVYGLIREILSRSMVWCLHCVMNTRLIKLIRHWCRHGVSLISHFPIRRRFYFFNFTDLPAEFKDRYILNDTEQCQWQTVIISNKVGNHIARLLPFDHAHFNGKMHTQWHWHTQMMSCRLVRKPKSENHCWKLEEPWNKNSYAGKGRSMFYFVVSNLTANSQEIFPAGRPFLIFF